MPEQLSLESSVGHGRGSVSVGHGNSPLTFSVVHTDRHMARHALRLGCGTLENLQDMASHLVLVD